MEQKKLAEIQRKIKMIGLMDIMRIVESPNFTDERKIELIETIINNVEETTGA